MQANLSHSGIQKVSARHSEMPPFSAISSSDNLCLGIRLGLGSVVWLWKYQEYPATTMNDGFQNGKAFGMAALWKGGPEPFRNVAQCSRIRKNYCSYLLSNMCLNTVNACHVYCEISCTYCLILCDELVLLIEHRVTSSFLLCQHLHH